MPMRSPLSTWAFVGLAAAAATPRTQSRREPVIDMHVHAYPSDWVRRVLERTATDKERLPDPPNPVTGRRSGAQTDDALLQATLAAMAQSNIVHAVASGPLATVYRWKAADPERILGAPLFPLPRLAPFPELPQLAEDYATGRLFAMGEVTAPYGGLAPSDEALEPYFDLCEKRGIPVGVHTGLAIPAATYDCCPGFRIELCNPLHVEPVLARHPKLRLYLMHAGYPYLEATIAVLGAYPDVQADLAAIDWLLPEAEFHDYLRRLVRAGLGKRLLFGTDQIVWPDAFELAISRIESAPFLTREQKRDILYNNAARFLRLGPEPPAARSSS